MGAADTIQNIINNIDSFFASLTETPPDSYIPLNYHNIKYMSFILCLFLFFIENIFIIFIKIKKYTINYIYKYINNGLFENPDFFINDNMLKNPTFYINFNIFILIIVSFTFLNIFFIKNIFRFMVYIGCGIASIYVKSYIQTIYNSIKTEESSKTITTVK